LSSEPPDGCGFDAHGAYADLRVLGGGRPASGPTVIDPALGFFVWMFASLAAFTSIASFFVSLLLVLVFSLGVPITVMLWWSAPVSVRFRVDPHAIRIGDRRYARGEGWTVRVEDLGAVVATPHLVVKRATTELRWQLAPEQASPAQWVIDRFAKVPAAEEGTAAEVPSELRALQQAKGRHGARES